VQQILVYGDSLSWGIIPGTRRRLPFEQRWPGILERGLHMRGHDARLLEDCLNGRRTTLDDPFKPGRNGLSGLAQRIESHAPLALVILFLGTNDFQSMHQHTAWHAAQGIAALVTAIREAPIEPGMPVPPILIVAPPPLGEPRGAIAPKFSGGDRKCVGLSDAYREVAVSLDCPFFDAGAVVAASRIDGVHLDAVDHRHLGHELVGVVAALLA